MAKEINLFSSETPQNTEDFTNETTPSTRVTTASTNTASTTGILSSSAGPQVEQMLDRVRKRKEEKLIAEATIRQAKGVIEAVLFAANEPISFQRLREILETQIPIKPRQLEEAIAELQTDYTTQQRSFFLEKIEGGFLLRSRPEYGCYIDELYRNKRGEKLSQAAMEVLAIILHRQPITRPQIDAIRGVDSSGTVAALLERGLIEAAGKLEAPGRPTLYNVTQQCLNHFGLSSNEEASTQPQQPE